MDQHVHTLYNAQGEISAGFPATLADMFALTRASSRHLLFSFADRRCILLPHIAEVAERLVREYGLGAPASSREKNINVLMQHCGIQYQLVRAPLASSARAAVTDVAHSSDPLARGQVAAAPGTPPVPCRTKGMPGGAAGRGGAAG